MRNLMPPKQPGHASVLLLALAIAVPGNSGAADELGPHRWQRAMLDGTPTAIALSIACPECPPAITLRCLGPRRGLMQLTIPAARAANGQTGVTKQITLTMARRQEPEILSRRATTHKTPLGYLPVIDLAADDNLIDQLMSDALIKVSFYGRRHRLRTTGASGPVAEVRALCQPSISANRAPPAPRRHCTWTISIACSPTRREADFAANRVEGAFVRKTPAGHCATVAIRDLATARTRAIEYHAPLERSCLP